MSGDYGMRRPAPPAAPALTPAAAEALSLLVAGVQNFVEQSIAGQSREEAIYNAPDRTATILVFIDSAQMKQTVGFAVGGTDALIERFLEQELRQRKGQTQ